MLWGERGIKGLDAKLRDVGGESGLIHQCERAESANVAVMESSRIGELK